jgi:hypothetical protein
VDQLAPAIKWIKKNVFWLCCGFLSIAMVAIWFVATISIAKQTDDFEKEVKNNITTAQGIMSVTAVDVGEGVVAHPNATSEVGMKSEIAKTVDSTIEAWRLRHEAQKEILIWPSVVDNDLFARVFGRYNPPETFPDAWENVPEIVPLLELYKSRIQKHMLYLCGDKVLRTRWNYDPAIMTRPPADDEDDSGGLGGLGGARGGLGGGRGGLGGPAGGLGAAASDDKEVDMNQYAVIWSDVNQELWYNKMTRFQGRDDNNRATNDPTPLQCYMLQQDLWLLEAMFNIIRGINGNSNANDLSDIKRIDHVVFGREVGGKLGSLTPFDRRLGDPTVAAADPSASLRGDEDDTESYDEDDEPEFGGRGTRGAAGAVSYVGKVPYHNRYVDVNFEPIDGDVVRQVIEGTALPETNLELIVAKRVPVRIALRMDERRIPDFMAACANSPFAFEIQQVRWNKHKPGGEEIAFDGGAGTGDGGNSLGGMGMGLDGAGPGGGAALVAKPVEVRTNFDVNVEFYGIVKIYNPVRAKFLKQAAGLEVDSVDPNAAADTTGAITRGDSTP